MSSNGRDPAKIVHIDVFTECTHCRRPFKPLTLQYLEIVGGNIEVVHGGRCKTAVDDLRAVYENV